MNETEEILKHFLDEKGRLVGFPSKRKMKTYALLYLSEKIETKRQYTEKEINALLDEWSTFGDPATLRRELYNNRFINRDGYGHTYWKEEIQPTAEKLGLTD